VAGVAPGGADIIIPRGAPAQFAGGRAVPRTAKNPRTPPVAPPAGYTALVAAGRWKFTVRRCEYPWGGWVAEAWPPGSALGTAGWVWAAWRQTEAEAWSQAREFAREKGLVPEGV
jgi:hypothetical protein